MVGPDYVRPEAPTAADWIEAGEPQMVSEAADYSEWWTVFDDPILDSLVERAYAQNLSLETAGLRVLEAQARRGIAVGGLFPQFQEAFGTFSGVELSEKRANQGGPIDRSYGDWQAGFDAAWEIDIWGRFRRGIEAADADLIASLASYDDVLVTLVAEVANAYVRVRLFEELLDVARGNVEIQSRSLQITEARFRNGMVTELDVAQARSLLHDTEARIPQFESFIRQAQNTLCVLLGIPPQDLTEMLGGSGMIPASPPEVAVGIPAELLRRRPDIRAAERAVAAQSARIGVAAADLYPRFSLVGNISLAAEDFDDLFRGDSFDAFGGPSFRWAILNYGRIRNNIRVQDAIFQQLVTSYEDAVLRAQQEVEDAMVGYLSGKERIGFLTGSVEASQRSVRLSDIQYKEGSVDYVRVLNAQQFLQTQESQLVNAKGIVALNLIAMYKALGGGWELRTGSDYVREETKEEMRARTNWGGLLDAERGAGAGGGRPGEPLASCLSSVAATPPSTVLPAS
jgi:NodT family efflux transporter outer membrane factor (OMF) lipoprotein